MLNDVLSKLLLTPLVKRTFKCITANAADFISGEMLEYSPFMYTLPPIPVQASNVESVEVDDRAINIIHYISDDIEGPVMVMIKECNYLEKFCAMVPHYLKNYPTLALPMTNSVKKVPRVNVDPVISDESAADAITDIGKQAC